MFKKFRKLRTKNRIFFTLLIAFAVVSFWRGIWGLMDIYLFPNNPELSLWASLFLGLLILVLTGYAAKELT